MMYVLLLVALIIYLAGYLYLDYQIKKKRIKLLERKYLSQIEFFDRFSIAVEKYFKSITIIKK